MKETVEIILPHLEPPLSFSDRSATDLDEPIFKIDLVGESQNDLAGSLESLCIDGHGKSNGKMEESRVATAAPIREEDTANGVGGWWKPDDWTWATVKRNHRVTRADWWQEVREVELDLEGDNM